MPADPNRLKNLFAAAIELATPASRQAFLDRECADDPDLRARLDALLRAHDAPASALNRPLGDLADLGTRSFTPDGEVTADHASGRAEGVGAILGGRYKLVEEIGEGGMGAVYMAQQTEPVKRAVAVKVIKAGMDSRAVLARFEAERQALAMMDHPNIARVLDAGTTESGRPYFVMELVKGTPITQFCDERKLTPRQRLELFVLVCNAIQHAHQKGVIHRDIKPSNVLVALYDDRPVPKVIDFGVAKATGQTLTDRTLMTGFGAVVGTPEYMSPEQASLNNLDIDTRSDVYSLGVLLYELLTGHTPVDRKSLGKAALLEVLRIVREVDAPRPSAKLSTIDTLPSVAANRGTEPTRLSKLMKGELDWVLLKALEKDRSRRYESANGLARDVQRYLADEIVEARPPSAGYRLRKFVRRHKGRVAATTAFLALLVAAVAVSGWLAVKAMRAEAQTEVKRIEAEANGKLAEENAAEAQNYATRLNRAWVDNFEERVNAEVKSMSLQVDLDLWELQVDKRVGLLRLAKPIQELVKNSSPEAGWPIPVDTFAVLSDRRDYTALREFMTVAVLTTGQNYASLLPPITHYGQVAVRCEISQDANTLLTLGEEGTARLWNVRTAKPIATLRQDSERVVSGGFSTDGKTVFTDDETGVARFWEPSGGAYRAKIEQRPNLYAESIRSRADLFNGAQVQEIGRTACMKIGRNRLLTQRVVAKLRPRLKLDDPQIADQLISGPVELWDTTTGKLVARLDRPGRDIGEFRFLREGEWVATIEGDTTVVLFAADDGREIARLNHPGTESIAHLDVSPNGTRLAVIVRSIVNGHFSWHLQMWDTKTWQSDPRKMSTLPAFTGFPNNFQMWDHDYFGMWALPFNGVEESVYRFGQVEPIARSLWWSRPNRQTRDRIYDESGRVFNAETWQQLRPPAGQRYHPDLARFAADGRYVATLDGFSGLYLTKHAKTLIDTKTQKQFPIPREWSTLHHAHGFGHVAVSLEGGSAAVGLVPTTRLAIQPAALQLWAQVAVRGELGPDGEFVPWDEATWEKKRQELATIPPPHPDFPFPGHVATDKLHWLRAEYNAAPETDKLRRATELLCRAEANGDTVEAVRWRSEVDRRTMPIAPPPREKRRRSEDPA